MKKYLLGFAAVLLAVGFSAFTAKKSFVTDKYFIYQSGNQRTITNYIQTAAQPDPCANASTNCFFLVRDLDGNDVISPTEFETAFDLLDGDLGGTENGNLNDEDEIDSPDTDQVYDKKG